FWLNSVTREYFDVMGIRLLAGRRFAESDRSGNPPVALISESTARRFWTGREAIGQHLQFVGTTSWHTIVGVVADVRAYDLQRSEPSWMVGTAYVPYSVGATMENGQVPAAMTMVVRPLFDRPSVESTIRHVVSSVNADVAVSETKTMDAVLSDAAATPASTE